MNLSELGKTVAKYAPLLGSVLPIPGGAALGQLVASAFGGDINNENDLIKKINQDPDASIKLLEIQSHERIAIEQIAVDRLRAQNEEMANARNREIEVSKIETTKRDLSPIIIALSFISGYFLLAVLIVSAIWMGQLSAEELTPVIQMLKDVGLAIMLILSYYFGSSHVRNG